MTSSDPVEIAVVGAGIIGARIARELLTPAPDPFRAPTAVEIVTSRDERARTLRASFGSAARVVTSLDDTDPVSGDAVGVVVIAKAAGEQLAIARESLLRGRHVVATSDDLDEVEALLDLDSLARSTDSTLVVGAAMAPGFSCLLAAHAAELFDRVDEIHTGRAGAAGPGCARQRLKALRGTAVDWRDGDWVKRPGFSGRELLWFPDPIGARDCYRAALADPLLLVPAIDGVERVTARIAANRRDRALAPFPVLWPPPVEGGLGAIRVELRGELKGRRQTVVYGALDRPAVAGAATAAVAALWLSSGSASPGATGLAGLGATLPLLSELSRRGIRAAAFDGAIETPA
ncbi:MAG: Gfo/Idh/MocA family oxidoreductase [Microthrixaceae bacterium]